MNEVYFHFPIGKFYFWHCCCCFKVQTSPKEFLWFMLKTSRLTLLGWVNIWHIHKNTTLTEIQCQRDQNKSERHTETKRGNKKKQWKNDYHTMMHESIVTQLHPQDQRLFSASAVTLHKRKRQVPLSLSAYKRSKCHTPSFELQKTTFNSHKHHCGPVTTVWQLWRVTWPPGNNFIVKHNTSSYWTLTDCERCL